jgi:uncharacterized membrane protein YfcA
VSDPHIAAALLVLALAAFVQGVFGLGFAMIATPLLALFLEVLLIQDFILLLWD